METERSPLLGVESPFKPPEPAAPPPPYSEVQEEIDNLNDAGPSTSFVKCDVCNYMITKSSTATKSVITCPRCNETTALQAPEKGKRYLRCPECNCLLKFKDTLKTTICPRKTCKVTIDVKSGKPLKKRDATPNDPTGESISQEPQYRITCGHCRNSFVQTTLPARSIRCPICRKKSNIGEGSGKRSAIIYIVLGLVCIVACLTLMGTTMGLRHNAGYWYIYMILQTMAVGFIVFGLWIMCMRQSTLQIAVPPV